MGCFGHLGAHPAGGEQSSEQVAPGGAQCPGLLRACHVWSPGPWAACMYGARPVQELQSAGWQGWVLQDRPLYCTTLVDCVAWGAGEVPAGYQAIVGSGKVGVAHLRKQQASVLSTTMAATEDVHGSGYSSCPDSRQAATVAGQGGSMRACGVHNNLTTPTQAVNHNQVDSSCFAAATCSRAAIIQAYAGVAAPGQLQAVQARLPAFWVWQRLCRTL